VPVSKLPPPSRSFFGEHINLAAGYLMMVMSCNLKLVSLCGVCVVCAASDHPFIVLNHTQQLIAFALLFTPVQHSQCLFSAFHFVA